MATTLLNAPLVELIAELRWPSGSSSEGANSPTESVQPQFLTLGPSSELELTCVQFAVEVAKLEYRAAERIVPPGFPALEGQPIYRFRKQAEVGSSSLYQVGAGVFTANAVPPYQNWAQFSPVVKDGVTALLASRSDAERDRPFTGASLRYIDAFGTELTNGLGVADFISRTLGFGIQLPEGVAAHIEPSSEHKVALQVQLPMVGGMILSLSVGEGVANGKSAILMDTTVAMTAPVAASVDAVMDRLNAARDAIHSVFFAITGPIQSLMQPQGEQ